jgi:hypothetical protein
MRLLLVTSVVCAASASVALAAPRTVSTSGLHVTVPAGWHATVSKTPSCDPERLIVASSAPLHVAARGRLALPGRTDVLVLLLEDRYVRDRPVGGLPRPPRFSVRWHRLVRVQGDCGLPVAPAFMRYFRSRGRYLGFIVYPGAHVGTATRAKTLALMDSLRVSS